MLKQFQQQIQSFNSPEKTDNVRGQEMNVDCNQTAH